MRSNTVLLGLAGAGFTAASTLPRRQEGSSDLVQRPPAASNLTGANVPVVSVAAKTRSGSIAIVRKSSTDARVAGLTNVNLTQDRGSLSGMIISRRAIPSGSTAPRVRSSTVGSVRQSSKSEDYSAINLAQVKDVGIDTGSRLDVRGVVGGSRYDPGPMSNHAKNVAVIAIGAVMGGIALSGAAIYGARHCYIRRQKKQTSVVV
jgi:hypothetical protein